MSSYAILHFKDLILAETRNEVDPTIMALFSEDDKRTYKKKYEDDENEEYIAIEYAASLKIIKDRLEFMGFTMPVVRQIFDECVRDRMEELVQSCEDPQLAKHDVLRDAYKKELKILHQMSFKSWLEALMYIIDNKIKPDRKYWDEDEIYYDVSPIVRFLLGNSFNKEIWFPSYDFRVFIRALIDAAGTDDAIIYDLSDLSAGEYIDSAEDFCAWSKRQIAEEFMLHDKVIVLTEGKSDSIAIGGALNVLYPHLVSYYSLMDFENMRVPGGAGTLVNLVKSLAGAGIVNRIIAVFDNDTAAAVALRGMQNIKLPDNIRIIQYPEYELANKYPTYGPQGILQMNVNGLAGSLELYFGRDVLQQSNGELTAVQWRGYDETLKRYQGELINKAELRQRFDQKLKTCLDNPPEISKYDWTGMKLIVDKIRTAFH